MTRVILAGRDFGLFPDNQAARIVAQYNAATLQSEEEMEAVAEEQFSLPLPPPQEDESPVEQSEEITVDVTATAVVQGSKFELIDVKFNLDHPVTSSQFLTLYTILRCMYSSEEKRRDFRVVGKYQPVSLKDYISPRA